MSINWSPAQEKVFSAVADRRGGNLIVRAVAGSGKCLGPDTPVLLYNGNVVPVQDVQPHDLLMGPDSQPRTVESTTTGHGRMVRVVPVKGDSWTCNDDHILTLAGTNRFNGQTIDISVKDYRRMLQERPSSAKDWKLVRAGVEFEQHKDLPLDPYLVGIWLGDGATDAPVITNPEPEILAYCHETAPLYGCEAVDATGKRPGDCAAVRFRVGTRGAANRNTPHTIWRALQACKDEANHKHIPQAYLTAARDDRLAMLAGLLDTDGSLSRGGYDITSKYEHLADEICFLARSLGLAAYKHASTKGIKALGFTGNYYRVSISGDLSIIPCRVPRKKAQARQQIKRTEVTGFALEDIGEGEYHGFTLDGDGRFLLGDFTVTHNTTTLVEAANRLDPSLRCLFLAFNKSIADELQRRLPPHVEAKTFHAICLRALTRSINGPRPQIEAKKLYFIVDEMAERYVQYKMEHPEDETQTETVRNLGFEILAEGPDPSTMLTPEEMEFSTRAVKLAGLAKNEGVGPLQPDLPKTWSDIIDRYDVDVDDEPKPRFFECCACGKYHNAHKDVDCGDPAKGFWSEELDARYGTTGWQEVEGYRGEDTRPSPRGILIGAAHKLLEMSEQDRLRIDFDDMLYRCCTNPRRFDHYDVVFVDEVQDTNLVQRHILEQLRLAGSRIIGIGDGSQAIYLFRGAGANSMDLIKQDFNCTELPLTVTFRCGREIVREAQGIVPDIEAAPQAEEGTVQKLAKNDKFKLEAFEPEDVVLCRLTAPLVSLAYRCIGAGVGCRVLGRNIGEGLIVLIKKMRSHSLLALRQALDDHLIAQTEHLLKKHQDEKLAALTDKVESIQAAMDSLPEGGTVQHLIRHIEGLFSHDNDRGLLTLCTAHRAKGLEWDRVFILEPQLFPSKWAKTPEAKQQEANLRYVAITRARKELVYLPKECIE